MSTKVLVSLSEKTLAALGWTRGLGMKVVPQDGKMWNEVAVAVNKNDAFHTGVGQQAIFALSLESANEFAVFLLMIGGMLAKKDLPFYKSGVSILKDAATLRDRINVIKDLLTEVSNA